MPEVSIYESKVYTSPGHFRVEIYISCGCNSLLNVFTYTDTAVVPPEEDDLGPSCIIPESDIDSMTYTQLTTLYSYPYEEAFVIRCLGPFPFISERMNSNPIDENGEEDDSIDPCAVTISPAPGPLGVAVGHSHPIFLLVSQMNAGAGCFGKTDWNILDLADWMGKEPAFSVADKNYGRKKKIDVYLVDGLGAKRKYLKFDHETNGVSDLP